MSLLLLVSLYEFRQFLQIVLWIAVPATLIAVALTIFLHYRRKKKQEGLELAFHDENGWSESVLRNPASSALLQTAAGDHPEGLPDWLASANPDNTSLLKKYEQEVRRYRENYSVLEQDFRELEEKYADLRNKAYHTDKEGDTTLVTQLQKEIKAYKEKISRLQQAIAHTGAGEDGAALPLQATLQQLQEDLRSQQEEKERYATEIAQLEQLLKNMEHAVSTARDEAARIQHYHTQQVEDQGLQYKNEKDRLSEQLQQVQQLLQQLQEENNRLQLLVAAGNTAAVAIEQGTDERVQALQQLLAQTESERKALKEQLAEQEYLPDVLEEKRTHIDFLQRQLEQRIKNYHLLEKQAGDSAAQLQQLQITMNGFDQQIQRLTGELQAQQQQTAEWQSALQQSQQEGKQQQEVILAKTGHIEQLEQHVQELKGQQGTLQTEIAEQQQSMQSLQQHLASEQHKAAALETKLELSSQLLLRIYAELAKTLGNHALVNTEQTELAAANQEAENEQLQLQASL